MKAAARKTQADDGNPVPYLRATDLIIEHLEKGVVTWSCPCNGAAGWTRNFQSGQPCRGFNTILPGMRFTASPWWMTYWQTLGRRGHVRKGERGAMVVKHAKLDFKSEP